MSDLQKIENISSETISIEKHIAQLCGQVEMHRKKIREIKKYIRNLTKLMKKNEEFISVMNQITGVSEEIQELASSN